MRILNLEYTITIMEKELDIMKSELKYLNEKLTNY